MLCLLININFDITFYVCRYDARAFLTDLTEYDADVIRTWSEPMTEKERQVKRLLDEERYLELTADYDLQMMFEGEADFGVLFLHLVRLGLFSPRLV